MKIIRNGNEYELTSDELYRAYLEQEHLYDRENIELNMQARLDAPIYEALQDNDAFIEDAAYQLRRNQDEYDMDYESALDDAISSSQSKHTSFVFDEEIGKPLVS